MSQSVFSLALVLTTLGSIACGGSSEDGTSADDAEVTAGAATVSAAKAERLLGALGALDAVDQAMGGRLSASVGKLSCVTSSNVMLDETDALYRIPITRCEADVANHTPLHVTVEDKPARAGALFDALADVSDSLSDTAAGTQYVGAKSASCSAQFAGAGAAAPGVVVPAKCTVKSEGGATFAVTGAKAARLLQALALAEVTDEAMGGRVSAEVTNVDCANQPNLAVEASDPMNGISQGSCKMNVSGRSGAVEIKDEAPRALALLGALEKAGLKRDAAMGGKSGVTAKKASCKKGPGIVTSCNITR